MEKPKLNLPLPLPLYRGIAVEGPNAGKMIDGSALFSIIDGAEDISIVPPEINAEATTIRPETLGIYIGKEDMNGKNIFTGDVLVNSSDVFIKYFLVFYSKDPCRFLLHSSIGKAPWTIVTKYLSESEIIGSIHENPELLELFPHLPG